MIYPSAQLSRHTSEIEVDVDPDALAASFSVVTEGVASAQEMRRCVGALALATPTIDEAARRVVIAARLPVHTWPNRRMLLTAVDAESGELVVFTRDSGVELIDAVAASSAGSLCLAASDYQRPALHRRRVAIVDQRAPGDRLQPRSHRDAFAN